MAVDAPEVQVDSSPTDVLKSLTPAQHKTWRNTGDLPEAKSKEAPKSETAPAESSPAAKPESAAAPAKATETPAEPAPAKTEPKAKNAETRVPELLSERAKLRAENAELHRKLDELQKAPVAAPAKSEAPAKPHRNDTDPKTGQPLYADDDAYLEARDKWVTEQASYKTRQDIAKEYEQRNIAEQNQILRKRMENSIKLTTEKHPDFLEVVQAKEVEKDGKKVTVFGIADKIKTGGMIDAFCLDSEIGMEILYHLIKTPEELERINGLNPIAATRELTKLEIKLSEAPPATPAKTEETPAEGSTAKPKVSSAPAPAASVGGKGTAPTDEEGAAVQSGDFRRFKKAADAEEFRKKKAS